MALLLGNIDLLASRTVYFDSTRTDLFAHPDWQSRVPVTQDPRTHSKGSFHELLFHDGQTLRSDDVASMDKAVDVGGFLVNR